MTRPTVLFVCVKNGGKSQIAGAIARHLAGDRLRVLTAGTNPGSALNEESRIAVAQVGGSFEGEYPKPMPDLTSVDRVIVLGREAQVEADHEVWDIDEPSLRGIEGAERMDLMVAEIGERVRALVEEMTA